MSAVDERLSTFVEEVSKIRGVAYVTASSEGFPYMTKGTDREGAEYASAIASSMLKSIEELALIMDKGKPIWLKVYLPEDYRVQMFQYKNLAVAIKYEAYLEKVIDKLIDNLRKEITIRCPHCKRDLTFVTVRCPSCGSLNVFNEPKCWSCGADLRLKRCPYCGGLVFYDGRKPSFFTLLVYRIKRIFGLS